MNSRKRSINPVLENDDHQTLRVSAEEKYSSQETDTALSQPKKEKAEKAVQDPSETLWAKLSGSLRFVSTGIRGFLKGLLLTPATLLEGFSEETSDSTLETILRTPLETLTAVIKGPFEFAAKEIGEEKNLQQAKKEVSQRLAQNEQYYNSRSSAASSRKWTAQTVFRGLSSLVLGFIGLIVGFIKIPFVTLSSLANTARNENFLLSLLYAPFRLIATIITTPYTTAKAWALSETEKPYEQVGSGDKNPLRRDQEQFHYSLSTLSDYLRVSFHAISGFILACIAAPLVALDRAWNTDRYESLKTSLRSAPRRFFSTLFMLPFDTAAAWVNDERSNIDKEKAVAHNANHMQRLIDSHRTSEGKLSPAAIMAIAFGLVQIGLSYLSAFVAGILKAPLAALSQLNKPDLDFAPKSIFLSALITFPLHFLAALIKTPFTEAKKAMHKEIDNVISKAAIKEPKNASPTGGIVGHLAAAIKGLVGFAIGALFATFIGIHDFIRKGRAYDQKEDFFSSVVRAPLRLLGAILKAPFQLAADFAFSKEKPVLRTSTAHYHQELRRQSSPKSYVAEGPSSSDSDSDSEEQVQRYSPVHEEVSQPSHPLMIALPRNQRINSVNANVPNISFHASQQSANAVSQAIVEQQQPQKIAFVEPSL